MKIKPNLFWNTKTVIHFMIKLKLFYIFVTDLQFKFNEYYKYKGVFHKTGDLSRIPALFSSPEPKAQVSYCSPFFVRCASSVNF